MNINDYEKLPAEMKDNARFCLWRYVTKNDRLSKIPFRTDGKAAKSTDPQDFSPLQDALTVLSGGGYDGIGIIISGRFSAIDIDDCIKDGVLSDMANDIIETMDSYTEKSPSGKGIRIIFDSGGIAYDKDRFYINRHDIGLEVYAAGCTSKYVTITGRCIRDRNVESRGKQMLEVAEKYMLRSKNACSEKPQMSMFLSDDEIVKKACSAANGEKFKRLHAGENLEYASSSEADLAYFSILAFWCGGDTAQMMRIAKSSGRYREKWERGDYLNNTILRAVDTCTEFYTPKKNVRAGTAPPKSPFPAKPVPLVLEQLPPFPVDALPKCIREYVLAVSESTQTPVDLAAAAALAVIAISAQGKYVITPKSDWKEPLNIYLGIFMPPSERKSSVCKAMSKPLDEYELEWNREHTKDIDFSITQKNILEQKLRNAEAQVTKGKISMDELRKASEELTEFKPVKPLRFYYDDITPEMLAKVLSENNGKAAIFSSEGGIIDVLKGIYSRTVNIDVFLKSYSGDPIHVDRIGRERTVVHAPALTIMLMAQPKVLDGIMENDNFRGRGLTARFLYALPESRVGTRTYRSESVREETFSRYKQCIRNILTAEPSDPPGEIHLSPEADILFEKFFVELEPKLVTEYADIGDWAGKLVGNVARLAGLLCIAAACAEKSISDPSERLTVSGKTMEDAIRIGRYYIEHAKKAFSILGINESVRNCQYVLNAIKEKELTEFTRRKIMQLCKKLKTADEVQSILDQLTDFGYIAVKEAHSYSGNGRPPDPTYMVNPCLFEA